MLSRYSVKKPYTVIVGVVIVLILGIVAFMGMQIDLLPNINLPYSVVVTTYVGATPEEVETVITEPVEQAMATVSNVKSVTSVSSENSSIVILEFNQDTDMTAASIDMREKIDMVTPYWTDDNIGTPMIMQINPNMIPVVVASVDMEGKTSGEMSAFLDDTILPKIKSVEGIASVTTIGGAENRIDVTIDDELIDDINEVVKASINGDISKAKALLSSARAQITAAYSQLESSKAEAQAEIDAAQSQIDEGKSALNEAKEQADAGLKQSETNLETKKTELSALEDQKADIEAQIKTYTDSEQTVPQTLISSLAEINDKITAKKAEVKEAQSGYDEAKAGSDAVDEQIADLDAQQAQLDSGKQQLEEQASSAKAQLDSGMSQIDSQSGQISSAAATAAKQADISQYITKEMISGILMAQNFSMPAGSIDAEEGEYTVKVGKDLQSLEDIENLLLFELDIDGVDDIRIKDVATVTTAGVTDDVYAKVNGNNGILLTVEKQSDCATATVSDNLAEAMEELTDEYEGFHYTTFMDQGHYVHLIIDSILENLLLGAVLAIIILLLFLRDIRPTLIVALSIPASLLFALVMMYFTGVTMNIISMSGLALGVGMLVDNSVVVIENIYRLRREGMSAREAAVEGSKQVAGAIIASTLTTVSVFVPIAFTNGLSKQLFTDMGLTISFSLVASLIVALTVVPSLGSRLLVNSNEKDSKVFLFLKEKYEKGIHWTLGHSKITIIGICALLVISVVLGFSRGFSFMPEYQSTEMTATLTCEDTEMTDTEFYAVADKICEAAMAIEGVDSIGAMDASSASTSAMMSSSNSFSVSMYINLEAAKTKVSEQVKTDLAEVAEANGCEISVSSSMDLMSSLGGSGISLTVKGDDLEELSQFTTKLGDDIAAVEGIDTVSSAMDNADDQLMITVDKDKAMAKGLTVAQVYQAVATEIAADTSATKVTIDGTEYSVFVIDDAEDKISVDDISAIKVEGENGKAKVEDIAEITTEGSPSAISHKNQQRYMSVSATVAEGAIVSQVTSDVKDLVDDYDTPEGISVEVGGESVNVQGYMEDLFKAIALAMVLMYLIMVAQFQSFRSPFIVMFTVPLAFTGGFLLLFITGFDVSVVALLGFLVLTGVVVNNGIVLVDYVNRLVDQGMELEEALVLGGKTRLRPILMTALTTILAMVTMALGLGEGTELVQPMAIVAIGGLVYATFMTLFFVPLMYRHFHGDKRKQKQRRFFRKKAAETPAIAETAENIDAISAEAETEVITDKE